MLRCISGIAAASRDQCSGPASGAFVHHYEELAQDSGPRVLGGAAVDVVMDLANAGDLGPGWGLTPGKRFASPINCIVWGWRSERARIVDYFVMTV
jgi:hypothetical protein